MLKAFVEFCKFRNINSSISLWLRSINYLWLCWIVSVYVWIYFSDVMVTNLNSDITYEGLCAEMRDICKFDEIQPFTLKWVDEEGMSGIWIIAVMYKASCLMSL